jgi:ubiquinone/menaquinone biosynthesis C-methylase UbiE
MVASGAMDLLSGMPQTPLQAQVAYYRRRAAEYDETSYGDVPRADRRIAALVNRLRPGGDLLEIACGTGIWTRHLPRGPALSPRSTPRPR